MRRWILYLVLSVLLALTDAVGFAGTDVGKLLPVETVSLAEKAGKIILETDTGDTGAGANVAAALEDLRNAATGNIFLETADYLILQPGCEKYLRDLLPVLRPSCSLCLKDTEIDIQKATEYLIVHDPQITLRDWCGGIGAIPELSESEGRVRFVT